MPRTFSTMKAILVLAGLAVLATLATVGVILCRSSGERGADSVAATKPAASAVAAISAAPAKVRLSRTKPAAPRIAAVTNEAAASAAELSARASQEDMSALQARVGQVAAEVRAAAARQVRTMTVNGKKIKVDPLLPMLTYFRIQQLALTPQQEAAIEIINGQFRPLVQQQRDEARPLGESLASNLRAAQESGDAGQVAAAQEAVNQYSIEQSKAAAELDRKYLQAVKPVLTTEQVQTLDREEELDRPTGRGGHG